MTIYTKSNFINFCHKVFGDYKLTNNGDNINVACPFCLEHKPKSYDKKKLVIHTETQIGHCWSCNYKFSNLIPILKKYHKSYLDEYKKTFHKNDIIYEKNEENKIEQIFIPDGFKLLATLDKNHFLYKKSINYLKNRNLDSEEDLWYWKLGVSNEDKKFYNRIIIPSFDTSGSLNFYSGRDITNKSKVKYENPQTNRENIVFNEINIDWEKELIITEGPFDLMKCTENATCLLGSQLTANYKLFENIVINKTPVILALDQDAYKKTLRIAKSLYEFDIPVKIYNVPKQYEDVGSMTKSEFKNSLDNVILFDSDYQLRYKINCIV